MAHVINVYLRDCLKENTFGCHIIRLNRNEIVSIDKVILDGLGKKQIQKSNYKFDQLISQSTIVQQSFDFYSNLKSLGKKKELLNLYQNLH